MRTFKGIEDKPKVLGIPTGEFILLSGSVLAGFLFINITGLTKWLHLLNILTAFCLYFLLKYLNEKQHPDYLLSWIANKIQPDKIDF